LLAREYGAQRSGQAKQMSLSKFVPAPKAAQDSARFVQTYLLDKSARKFFLQDRMKNVVALAKQGNWSESSKEFREQTGADIKMSVFAAQIAAIV